MLDPALQDCISRMSRTRRKPTLEGEQANDHTLEKVLLGSVSSDCSLRIRGGLKHVGAKK
jgi:hypothetical protein